MIKEAKLRTAGIIDGDEELNGTDYELWKSIETFMDGEIALVIENSEEGKRYGEYVFLGLKDKEKDKELFYMMEQDSLFGAYNNDREAFNSVWESGEYEPCGYIYMGEKRLEFIQ